MRQRFKPNITPRGSRRPSTTNVPNTSTNKTPAKKPSSSTQATTNEQQNIEPFIPPNSSKAVEDNACEEIHTVEDTNEVVVLEKIVENEPAKQVDLKSSFKKSKDAKNAKPAPARRSRIKPSITPTPRRKNNTKTKTNNDNVDKTPEAQTFIETITEKDSDEDKSTSKELHLKQKHNKNNVNEISAPKPTETSTPKSTEIIPNVETPAQPSTEEDVVEDGNTQASCSLSRRRRATPKICIPPRKKRTTSISNESVDKLSAGQSETLQQPVDEEMEKEFPDEATVSGKTNKRQRIQEDAGEDIGVIEVTVQTGDNQDELAVQNEEQDNTEEEQPQTNKKVQGKGRKRRVPIRKPKEMLDPSKMTLQDLIYFNPKENFMKSSTDAKRKRVEQQKSKSSQSTGDVNSSMEVDETNTENQSNNQQTIDKTEGGGDSAVCAPQIKIAADGSIIVDEESLVIRSATNSTLEETEIVYEDANDVTFDFYGKGKKRTRWSMPETLKFYKALSQVGTDFQLMVPLFPSRSRKELKAKFKREEKINFHLIDKALVHRTPISLEMFLQAEKNESNTSKKKGKKQTANTADKETIEETQVTVDNS